MLENIEKEQMLKITKGIAVNANALPENPLTGFLSMRGTDYDRDLMVVGRATNGWVPGLKPDEMHDEQKVVDFMNRIEESRIKYGVHWVVDSWGNKHDYDPATSAFWRTTKTLLSELIQMNDEAVKRWSSKIVWSNLYKVAPKDGGNPSERLAGIQLKACRELLQAEILAYKPKRLVFATGGWANDFLDMPCFLPARDDFPNEHVERFGTIVVGGENIGAYVVAKHPQGKKERVWVDNVKFFLARASFQAVS